MPFNQIDPATGEVVYGVTPYTYQEALDILNENVVKNIEEETGGDVVAVDTSPTSILGKLNSIIATHISTLYEELLDIQDSFYLETATGTSLNKLALLVGFQKLPPTYTRGELRCFGENGTLLPAESKFSNLKGNEFTNEYSAYISQESCLSTKIKVLLVKDSKDYSVFISNNEYTITSNSSSTYYSILVQLEGVLSLDNTITTTLSTDLDKDSYIVIEKIDQTLTASITSSSLLENYDIEIEVPIQASESGVIFGDADTIETIDSPINGLEYVNNPLDFIIGTEEESDEDLKYRIETEFNTVGSGTPDTITALLEDLDYVRDVKVDENRTFVTDSNNIPAKNYEVIVSHEGDDTDIAEAVWRAKPLGVDTYGQTVIEIMDVNNEPQEVRFTNADVSYLHVKVDITKTPSSEGEVYPPTGDQDIQDTITFYGSKLGIDEDVIAKRFFGSVFNTVDGVATANIYVFADTTPHTDPSTITGWTNIEEIGRTEISTFATNRVFVNDVS